MRSNDKITGLVTVTFGVLVITNSRGLNNLPQQDYGAGTFPIVIGGLLIAFGGLLALRGLSSRAPLMVWVNEVPIKRFYLTLLAIVSAIVSYILLVPVLGFPIVSTALLCLLLYGFYRQNWTLAACTAIASTAVIWVVFGRLLQVPLELGILEEVVY